MAINDSERALKLRYFRKALELSKVGSSRTGTPERTSCEN